MRYISFNKRAQADAESTAEVEVVLIKITHRLLPSAIRLSSDNAERLSVEPLIYGTRSTWLTDDGSPFQFIVMGVQVPDETDDQSMGANLVIADLDSELAEILTSTTEPAIVSMALVYASSPDEVQRDFLDLPLKSADGGGDRIVFAMSRDLLDQETIPADRMTKERFPGLYQ